MVNESPALTFADHSVPEPVTVALPFVTLAVPVEYCDMVIAYLSAAHVDACDDFNGIWFVRPYDGLHALSNYIASSPGMGWCYVRP